jgi:hypothetical protein
VFVLPAREQRWWRLGSTYQQGEILLGWAVACVGKVPPRRAPASVEGAYALAVLGDLELRDSCNAQGPILADADVWVGLGPATEGLPYHYRYKQRRLAQHPPPTAASPGAGCERGRSLTKTDVSVPGRVRSVDINGRPFGLARAPTRTSSPCISDMHICQCRQKGFSPMPLSISAVS